MGARIRPKAAVNISNAKISSLSDIFRSELSDQKQRGSDCSSTKTKQDVCLRLQPG